MNVELTKELKYLKQQQLTNSKSLSTAGNEDAYPKRIKQLVEEIRVAKEQTGVLEKKLHMTNQEADRLPWPVDDDSDPEKATLVDTALKLDQQHAELLQE